MLVALPESPTALKLTTGSEPGFSDEAYLAFCRANPDLRVERTAEGEIVFVPPAGGESSYRSVKATSKLDQWAELDGRGKAFESSVQFFLPDGSALSPDAAWVSNEALLSLPKNKRKQFLALVPEFVIEVMSPSDRLKQAKAKMEQWISNGCQLGWLIDGDAETVYVYRRGHGMKVRKGVREIAGEGPVKGFVLQLDRIWEGL